VINYGSGLWFAGRDTEGEIVSRIHGKKPSRRCIIRLRQRFRHPSGWS
jgi:hypothetical protein